MRRLLLAAALCVSATTTARPQGYEQGTKSTALANAERAKPTVYVQEVPYAPLQVSGETKWATADQQMFEVYFTVTNVGSRPVRAYTVRVVHGVETQEGGGCYLNNVEKRGKILQASQSVGRSTWRPAQPSDPQPAVELALDFIEFTDGGTWGGDTCQSAERLKGLRAGARVAKAHFKKKLDEKGVDDLVKKLYADDPALAPPEGHSDAWKAGFRGAINSLRERIRQANVEGGLPEVEDALERPFDTTDNQ